MELIVAGPSQFSAQQVMEAGRRAEADGNLDHAHQFFTHVLAHYPGSPEAAAALEGTRRLDGARQAAHAQPVLHYTGAPNTGGPQANGRGAVLAPFGMGSGPAAQPVPLGRGLAPQGLNPINGAIPGYPDRSVPAEVPRHLAAPSDRAAPSLGQRRTTVLAPPEPTGPGHRGRRRGHESTEVEPPERPAAYPVGRALVRLLGFVAWLGIAAALAALTASGVAFVSRTPNPVVAMLAASPWFAAALLFGSIAVLLVAQMARAIFDTARTVAAQAANSDRDH